MNARTIITAACLAAANVAFSAEPPQPAATLTSSELKRMVADDMRELAAFTQSGLKWNVDFMCPFTPARISIWRQAAEHAIPDGQYLYAFCLFQGLAVQSNTTEAVTWYRKAADQGHALAQNKLGRCYEKGTGVPKDPDQAVAWFRKAAEQGSAEAQAWIGWCYETGAGVPKDSDQAATWYRKAAEQGYAYAQTCLGKCYASGAGVPKDTDQAVAWYRKAAENGDAIAKHTLEIYNAEQRNAALRTITSEYKSEGEYFIRETTELITVLLHMAANLPSNACPSFTTARDGKTLNLTVTVDGNSVSEAFSLTVNAWDPALYSGFCAKLAGLFHCQSATSSMEEKITAPELLCDQSYDSLRNASLKISRFLIDNPLDPRSYEQAAMVLAALALREDSGTYYDIRHTLNKMTAHLAVVRFLRKGQPFSDTGTLAEIALKVLTGRQVDAQQSIAAVVTTNRSIQTWLQVLDLRNCGDWRKVADPEKAPYVLKAEFIRAIADNVETYRAVDFMRTIGKETPPEWSMFIVSRNFSVEEGHLFTQPAVAAELELSVRVSNWCSSGMGKVAKDDLVPFLNKLPAKPTWCNRNFTVITDDDWARFCQRHLLMAIHSRYHFLKNKLGVPEEANAFEQEMTDKFNNLYFFPLEQFFWATTQDDWNRAMESTSRIVSSYPELMSEFHWARSRSAPRAFQHLDVIPPTTDWFNNAIPPGTVYNLIQRRNLQVVKREKSSFFAELLKVAPQNPQLLLDYFNRSADENNPVTNVAELAGQAQNYCLPLMKATCPYNAKDVNLFIACAKRICALDPDFNISVGHVFVEKNMDDEAAKAFQQALDHAHNMVFVANNMGWLVKYYYEHGQVSKAMAVAEIAAGVYSESGLEIMMWLQERMGHLAKAHDYGVMIRERYDSSEMLTAFYFRHRDLPEYITKFDQAVKEVFPEGLVKVSLDGFTKPSKGVLIREAPPYIVAAGVNVGSVIVAIDGYRIQTVPQYKAVCLFTDDPNMKLIVWQNGKYLEVKTVHQRILSGMRVEEFDPEKYNLK